MRIITLIHLGDENQLNVLIEKGADISLADEEGLTAVHFAALNRNTKIKLHKISSINSI